MIDPPERSDERDSAIDALLPHVAFDGWSMRALQNAAGPDADLLFPGGPVEMVEVYIDLADRRMEAEAARRDLAAMRLPLRIRTLIAWRLEQARPHRDAVRRAMGLLALPGNAPVVARTTARTVDSLWHAAGDNAADFSWYTKRAILAGVYGSTLLYWLRDDGDDAATLAFLDRRLGDVGRIGSLRRRLTGWLPKAA